MNFCLTSLLITLLLFFALIYPTLVYVWWNSLFWEIYDENELKGIVLSILIMMPIWVTCLTVTIANIMNECCQTKKKTILPETYVNSTEMTII